MQVPKQLIKSLYLIQQKDCLQEIFLGAISGNSETPVSEK